MYSVFSSQAMLPGTKNPFYPETGGICLNTGSLFSLLARVAHISKIIYHETSTVAMSWIYAYPPFGNLLCSLVHGLPKAAKKSIRK